MTKTIANPSTVQRLAAVALLVLVCGGCSDGDSGDEVFDPEDVTTITIDYEAATELDQDVVDDNPQCASLVAVTHVHPSWRNWTQVNMEAVGNDRWTVTFDDAPVDTPLGIRINDPNFCGENAFGWRTEDITVNDVEPTEIIATPVTGDHGDGLQFEVSESGRVR